MTGDKIPSAIRAPQPPQHIERKHVWNPHKNRRREPMCPHCHLNDFVVRSDTRARITRAEWRAWVENRQNQYERLPEEIRPQRRWKCKMCKISFYADNIGE